MFELGNPLSISGGVRAAGATRIGPKSPTLARTVASDDGVAVVIRNPLYAKQTHPDTQDSERNPFLNLSIEDTLAAVQKKVAELKQLAKDIRNGRFSARQTGDKHEENAEVIKNNTDLTEKRVYSDVSKLLARFKEEIEEIKSFDGFLLGVPDKIERFSPPAEFDLDQVQDVMQHMAEVTSKLELGVFSLARVREKALKALRCKDEPQPDRVLKLLEDDTKKSKITEQPVAYTAAAGQQNA
jgi:hypothetical protein